MKNSLQDKGLCEWLITDGTTVTVRFCELELLIEQIIYSRF